mgnify:CR=1 FL=1
MIRWEQGGPRRNGDQKRFTCQGQAGQVRVTSTGDGSSAGWKALVEFDQGPTRMISGHVGGIKEAIASAREYIQRVVNG